ncbi:MAG: caspase family protein [Chitinispirillaceae bacterium]|nr:caspase family protein [Chitinispirillaceae bacterium]
MKFFVSILLLVLHMFFTAHPAFSQVGRGIRIKDLTGKTVTSYRNSYALVVGASNYVNGWSNIAGAVQDAMKVKQSLEKHGFNVTIVENPTKETLRQALETFVMNYGIFKDNRLVFYFAGHGHSLSMATGVRMGYIVPIDAPLPNIDRGGFIQKAISMEFFGTQAKQIDANHVLYIFDSCFSGAIFSMSRAMPAAITEKIANPVRQFITAGRADEEVPDVSVFTDQLVKALDGEGDIIKDGYLSGTELGQFLQEKVVLYSNGTQHPQYGKIKDPNLDKGDFVFFLSKPSEPLKQKNDAPLPPKKEVAVSQPSTIIDNEKPIISDITTGDPREKEPFIISVEVTDSQSGVDIVRLAYRSESAQWLKADMRYVSANVYEYEIPQERLKAPELYYYFAAADKAGNKVALAGPLGQGFKRNVLKKGGSKLWMWIVPPVAALAYFLIPHPEEKGKIKFVIPDH